MTIRVLAALALVSLLSATGCSRAREYELRGQVLAVHAPRGEILVKHEDIRGFMPGMTMPFKVRDERLLQERTPGELIRATLVVEERGAHLTAIERTGMAPLVDSPPSPFGFDLLEPGEIVPDATFVDQTGTTRRISGFRGRTLAVTFIYTRCPMPDFCPLMDRHFAQLQTSVADDEVLAGRVRLLSISFDPDFDSPNVLAAHARRVGADPEVWSFVTAERAEVDRFASRFGVSIVREDRPAADILHNLRTAVIDPDGRLVTMLGGNDWQPSQLLAELRKTVGAR